MVRQADILISTSSSSCVFTCAENEMELIFCEHVFVSSKLLCLWWWSLKCSRSYVTISMCLLQGLKDEHDRNGVLLGNYTYREDKRPLQFFSVEVTYISSVLVEKSLNSRLPHVCIEFPASCHMSHDRLLNFQAAYTLMCLSDSSKENIISIRCVMQHVGIRQSSFELLCLMLVDRFTSTLRCSLDFILVCNILLIERFVWCANLVYCTQQWGYYLHSVSSHE